MTNEEAIKEIQKWLYGCPYADVKEAFNLAINALEERPKGEWISNNKTNCFGNSGRSCSLCGKIVEFSENFCPKCGADMRGYNHENND